jgi:hypothetical protein
MPDVFSSKSGFTRIATRAARPVAGRSFEQADLAERFDVEQDACRDRLRSSAFGLARPGEADLSGIHAASSATRSSPPEATSSPSTSPP